MAEEFQAGICGGTWWNSSKNVFAGCSSPCSMGVTADMGSFVWQNIDVVDMKARSCEESNTNNNNSNSTNNSVSDSSMVFGSVQKPQQADSDSGGSSILIDSTLQMMGFGLSSSTSSSDWNQAILRGSGRAESFNSMLQEDMNSRLSYRQETTGMGSSQIHKDWSPKSFTTAGEESSITNAFKPVNQDFSLDHQPLNAVASSSLGTSASYGYSPTLLQSLFEPEPPQLQPSLFNNRSMNYMSTANYSDGLSPAWSKLAPLLKPSLPKQQPGSLHFSNNTPFWNASATSLNNNRASFLPSSPSQFLVPSFEEVKPNCRNLSAKSSTEDARDSGSVLKKGINEPAFKRTRIETPSPLPTFKVRKEKLGDRITALQQLVSPFGKTDTASVLHEAIEYIKFLHEQVSVLSTPYMKQGAPIQPQQGKCDKSIESEGPKQDLRSRGLCLVPISSTFPVANETTPDFWTPTFGGTFR